MVRFYTLAESEAVVFNRTACVPGGRSLFMMDAESVNGTRTREVVNDLNESWR